MSTRHFVFCWELGAGLGHLAMMLPLAQALKRRGHVVTLIATDVVSACALAGRRGIPCLQAPLGRRVQGVASVQASLADILLTAGYATADSLYGLASAWRGLYTLLAPDMLICDYSPTAMFAARGLGIPVATLGSGFSIPPRLSPVPAFRTWESINQAAVEQRENDVVNTMNHVLTELAAPTLTSIADLYEVDVEFLLSFAELDHYRHRPFAEYLGLGGGLTEGALVPWPKEGKATKLFAYLKPVNEFATILAALGQSNLAVIAAAPGVPAHVVAQQKPHDNVRLLQDVANATTLIAKSDYVLCHAGAATVSQALLAGKPVICAEQAGSGLS